MRHILSQPIGFLYVPATLFAIDSVLPIRAAIKSTEIAKIAEMKIRQKVSPRQTEIIVTLCHHQYCISFMKFTIREI